MMFNLSCTYSKFDEQTFVSSLDMLLCLCTEETAAGAGEAASGPVEDWSRGEFSHQLLFTCVQ